MHMKFSYILVIFLFCACSASQPQNVVESDEQIILTDYASVEDIPDSAKQELDVILPPYSLSGNAYASIGEDNEIYLVDLDSGQTTQISHDNLPKAEVVLSEKYVVWLTQQAEVTVSGQDGENSRILLYGIIVYDRLTGEQRQITQDPAPRIQLAIADDQLVWMDKRNELEAHYTMYDIYGYNLVEDKEYTIAIAPGAQQNPSLHANYVVWEDNRDSLQKDLPLAGCGNCPDNQYDIYLYDFETESSQVIAQDNWLKSNPVVYDHYIVWEGYDDEFRIDETIGGTADLYLYNMDDRTTRRLTKSSDPESAPLFFQDRLLWTVRSACDEVNVQNGKEVLPAVGVYSLDLNTEVVYRLANDKEPLIQTDQETVMVLERCPRQKVYLIKP